MIRTPLVSGVVLVSVLLTAYMIGCVNVPSSGPAVPNYQAEFRVINLDPALVGATFVYANGPFSSGSTPEYTELALGAPGDNTPPYATWLAGSKKTYIKDVDTNISAVTFEVDRRGTLFVVPTVNIKKFPRFVLLNERYTFAPSGHKDTTRVKFFNSLVSKDTVSFWYNYRDAANNLVIGTAASIPFGTFSSYYIIPSGAVHSLYATKYIDGVPDSVSVSDTLTLTGVPYGEYTVDAYGDSVNSVSLKQFTNN